MKGKKERIMVKKDVALDVKQISRKEAIKKTGLVAASAATMMILMKSQKAQACSPVKSGHNQYGTNNQWQNHNQNNGPWKSGNNGHHSGGNSGPWKSGNNGHHSGGNNGHHPGGNNGPWK